MSKTVVTPERFSEYFKLNSNIDFEFCNIYAKQDIPLFLDPYGISAIKSDWSKTCETHIKTYFQYLVDSIKSGDKKVIAKLLNAFHEVNEVGLGYSLNQPSGRGIGHKQAKEIQEAFENSVAAKSGDIKDIADCALMIPGINRDKISDITSNILKGQLIEFTQEVCKRYKIPMKKVPVNNVFDYGTFEFISYYAELPVVYESPKILLPKAGVRSDPQLSKDKYYRNFVLEFLRAEHHHAGDSLSTVLKNGKLVVRIADLKAKYPIGTDFLYQFSKDNPKVLEKFKSELRRTALNEATKPVLIPKIKILTASERIKFLSDIPVGTKDATNFHKLSFDNLIHIFGDRLSNADSEVKINDGRKRIDIVFDNSEKDGFFNKLNTLHHIQCPKIFVECKNYGREIGNPEIDQLVGRFSKARGHFGILLCRSVENNATMVNRCKDVFHEGKGYVIVLDDIDVNILLKFKELEEENRIDEFMSKKLDEIIM